MVESVARRSAISAARARPRLELRSRHCEIEVHALEEPELLGRQAQRVALREQRVDAREQLRVEQDRRVVCGELRHHLALDRLQRGRGMRRREVVEHRADAHIGAAGGVERADRVVERGRRAVVRDRGGLAAMLTHRGIERGREVLRFDAVERRQAVTTGPGSQKRVVVGGHAGAWWIGLQPDAFRPMNDVRLKPDPQGFSKVRIVPRS
ncbi:MAG: hypothetical protein ACHP7L_05990 [Burkholderiales bacterium]